MESESDFIQLVGLQLLPLDDGSWTTYESSTENIVFIPTEDSPQNLLPGLEKCFIRSGLDESLAGRLFSLAHSGNMISV